MGDIKTKYYASGGVMEEVYYNDNMNLPVLLCLCMNSSRNHFERLCLMLSDCLLLCCCLLKDYKTSNEHNILHKKQVNIYKKGIKKILNTDKVFGYIVYLNKANIDIIKA
jgi:NADPH-dependent 7-cyano-7-deazaguanine reductase QueF